MTKLALLAAAAALAAASAVAQPQPNAGQPPGVTGVPGPGAAAGGTGAPAAGLPVSGTEFMRMAAMSDRFEIESSRLAQERAQNAQVKQFAEHMVRDHTRTTQELQQLLQRIHSPAGGGAQTSGVTGGGAGGSPADVRTGAAAPPAAGSAAVGGGPGGTAADLQAGLDAEQTRMIGRLRDARGAEFDRLYAEMQVQSHQKAVDLFASYARQGDNDQLRSWASQTLPGLQQHLQQAQQLARGL
jgi:putative membrane protein